MGTCTPGPRIRVRQGDRVRVEVTNRLPEEAADQELRQIDA